MTDGLPRTLRNDEQKLRKKRWFSWLSDVGAGIKSKFDQYAEAQQRLRDQSDIWFRESDEEEEENQKYEPITHLFHQNHDNAEVAPTPSANSSNIRPDISDFSGNYDNRHDDTLTLDQNPLIESTTHYELSRGNENAGETDEEFISAIESESGGEFNEDTVEHVIDEEGEIDEEEEVDEENEIDEEGEIDEEYGVDREVNHPSPNDLGEDEDLTMDYDPEKSDHTLWSEVGFDGYDHIDEAINREVNETPSTNFERFSSEEFIPENGQSTQLNNTVDPSDNHSTDHISKYQDTGMTIDSKQNNSPQASPEIEEDLVVGVKSAPEDAKSEMPKIYQALNTVNVGFDFGPNYSEDINDAPANNSAESHTPQSVSSDGQSTNTNNPSPIVEELPKSNEEVPLQPNEEETSTAEQSRQKTEKNEQSSKDWNLFDVGFTVAPDPDASFQDKSLDERGNFSFDQSYNQTIDTSFDFPEPEPDNLFDNEVRLQARMAHRLLSNSTLFGGTKAVKRKTADRSDDLEKNNYDKEGETRKSIKTARSLFSQSSLFGGNSKRQKFQHSIPEITKENPNSEEFKDSLKTNPPKVSTGNRRRRAKPQF